MLAVRASREDCVGCFERRDNARAAFGLQDGFHASRRGASRRAVAELEEHFGLCVVGDNGQRQSRAAAHFGEDHGRGKRRLGAGTLHRGGTVGQKDEGRCDTVGKLAATPHAIVMATGRRELHGHTEIGFVSVRVSRGPFEASVCAAQIEERIAQTVDDHPVFAPRLAVSFARSGAALCTDVLPCGTASGVAALFDFTLRFAEEPHGLAFMAIGWLRVAVPHEPLGELMKSQCVARSGIHGNQAQVNRTDFVVQDEPGTVMRKTHRHFHGIGTDRSVVHSEAGRQRTGGVFSHDLRAASLEQIEARVGIEVGFDVRRGLRQSLRGRGMQRNGSSQPVTHEQQTHAEVRRRILSQHIGMAAMEFVHEGVLRGNQPGCAAGQPVGQPCLDASVLDGIDQTELDGIVVDLLGGDAVQTGQGGMRALMQHNGREELRAASEQVAFVDRNGPVAHADAPTRAGTRDAHRDVGAQRSQTGQAFQPGPHFFAKLRLATSHAAHFHWRINPHASAMRTTARSSASLSSCPR